MHNVWCLGFEWHQASSWLLVTDSGFWCIFFNCFNLVSGYSFYVFCIFTNFTLINIYLTNPSQVNHGWSILQAGSYFGLPDFLLPWVCFRETFWMQSASIQPSNCSFMSVILALFLWYSSLFFFKTFIKEVVGKYITRVFEQRTLHWDEGSCVNLKC